MDFLQNGVGMITFTALKILLGGWLKTMGEFIAANWRWLLPLLAGLFLWWYITSLQDQRDKAINELSNWKQAVKNAADARRAENRAKKTAADRADKQNTARHAAQIEILKGQLLDEKNTHGRDVGNWRERLRLDIANAANGLPGNQGAAQGFAEGGRDCHPATTGQALENLEIACAVTTADYNTLRQWADDTCEIYDCD